MGCAGLLIGMLLLILLGLMGSAWAGPRACWLLPPCLVRKVS